MELSFERDRQPLAARMRPRVLEEFIGQDHIIGPGRLLRRAIEADQLQSIVLSGPPGTGKTTLARIIAERTRSQFLAINAVLSGVKDIREAIEKARGFAERTNRRTLLFVDEVHRWNKSQQDALLPWVENGLLVLIGATTENPFFEVNRALLSRSRVFLLTPLTHDDLQRVIDFALADTERGYGNYHITITPDAREHLITAASGDARTLLNALELAVETGEEQFPPAADTGITVTLETAEDSIQRRAVLYDKDGDYHFDAISAFIKSVRGSDPDAALFWLARMITAGEDPRYILRRLLILAAEDVGLADPHATSVVAACATSFDRVGMPEGQFHLAHATLYCSLAHKSNSTLGFFDAMREVQETRDDEVPNHLRDASRDGADLGHGQGYMYPHAYRDHWVAQQYLPETLQGKVFYQPGRLGWEGDRREDLEDRRQLQLAAESEQSFAIYAASPGSKRSKHWQQRALDETLTEVSTLREAVVSTLAPVATDRVLLCGAPLQLFAGEFLRRTPAGLTAIWSRDENDIHTIEHLQKRRIRVGVERAQTAGPVSPGWTPSRETTPNLHPGPFERILCRALPEDHPKTLVNWLKPLGAADNRLLCLDVLPREGTRPSLVLDLPHKLNEVLTTAEYSLFPAREELWQAVLSEFTLIDRTTFSRISTTTTRSITRASALSWFEDGEPLFREIVSVSGRETLEEIRRFVRDIDERRIEWHRTFLSLLIRSV